MYDMLNTYLHITCRIEVLDGWPCENVAVTTYHKQLEQPRVVIYKRLRHARCIDVQQTTLIEHYSHLVNE